MKLSAPTQIVFIISVILAIIGILPLLGVSIAGLGAVMTWGLLAGYLVLLAGVLFQGM